MQTGWKFTLLLIVAGTLCQCMQAKKTKTKLLKKLSHVGLLHLHKASTKTEPGQKKDAVQPTHEQVAAMQNPESLQPSDTEILHNLQNYNKHYINNEMASETALLADNGIDDDSALKISNLAALPHGMPASAGANVAIKAKITSNANAQVDESADHPKVSNTQGGFDPNAYLYDANSWPEYSIHDSDYSNFHAVEMSNMNGENTDMPPMYNIPGGTGSRNMGSEGGMEYPGGQRFPQGKTGSPAFNDEMKEAKGEALQKRPGEESNADKPSKEMNRDNSGEGKSDDDSGSNGVGKSQGSVKPQAEPVQPPPQKPDHANDPAAQEQQQTQPQQQQQQQRQQQMKEAPRKQSPSIVQAAASLPPKSIASLVSSLVGGGKTVEVPVGQGEGQIQKNIDGTIAHSLISQDSNPAAEVTQSATELHKIARPKKH